MTKKAKQKKIQRELKETEEQKTRLEHLLPAKPINNIKGRIIHIATVALTLITGLYFLLSALSQNGYWGFPLDDPWIHLTFAKNLVDYHSFSYFRNEIVTSGSTSPIYTVLLALLFFISSNEFIISYAIGIFFSMVLVFFAYKLFSAHFSSFPWIGAAAVVLLAIQPKLNLISVSGMETSMFIALLVIVFYFYLTKKWLWLGISLGLTIWCRPDGFVIWLAILIDYVIHTKYVIPDQRNEPLPGKEFIFAFITAGILAVLYFGFNYILSGEILPNTYSAKLEYYQKSQRSLFLSDEVIKYFSSAEFAVIWIPFLVGFIAVTADFIKKKRNEFLVYFLFVIGFILMYYLMLPFSHRFGRYLMPVIPFYILTSFYGIKIIIDFLLRKKTSVAFINFLFIAFTAACIILSVIGINNSSDEYSGLCRYHNERHVAAGIWLRKNTSYDDVIATHDIGAIAFYSDRKIIDMAGLVTPELIQHINDKNYSSYVNNYLAQHKVDYLVTLRNWFEVANDNPVFIPVDQFEYLEVFKYKTGKTHIMPKEASIINTQAVQYLQQNNIIYAENLLQQSLGVDPGSSKTLLLSGAIAENKNDFNKAESYYRKALAIFPEYSEAYFGLARVSYKQGKYAEAYESVNRCLDLTPDYKPAQDLMALVKSKIPNQSH